MRRRGRTVSFIETSFAGFYMDAQLRIHALKALFIEPSYAGFYMDAQLRIHALKAPYSREPGFAVFYRDLHGRPVR